VDELVNYGLAGHNAPSIQMTGVHLEPNDYHAKMAEKDTVIIDVRNHYESVIGHFTPPPNGAQLIDPKMRKSTEFPLWLDKPETKKLLQNKQVLMYCTGGVRCERASALLRTKMETEADVKDLNIKGVYQLQGGVDKYFKNFPEGGYWKGKNYTFDKRFAHAPPLLEVEERYNKKMSETTPPDSKDVPEKKNGDNDDNSNHNIMGKCEACSKPWDMYRGKRRCPTCGVPSLICKSCFEKDKSGVCKLGKHIKCTLCREENITSKKQVKERDMLEMQLYKERRKNMKKQEDDVVIQHAVHDDGNSSSTPESSSFTTAAATTVSNPQNITRLFLKNLNIKQTTQSTLMDTFSTIASCTITHIQWLTDYKSGKFYGSAFVECGSVEDACRAVQYLNGTNVFGRKMMVKLSKADGKDIWPPPNCAV